MKKQDKLMSDFHRLLNSQDSKSEAELRKFMEGIMRQPIPSFPKESLTIKEQAQDLIFEAQEQPDDKGFALALKAIKMDRDCIEAYEYLGSLEPISETAMLYFKNGIEIGRRIFADTYFKDGVGNFWMIHETRPFMRCLQAYSDCLADIGEYHAAVSIFEEMIKLNPNDNQGVRNQLLLYLIKINEFSKFIKYDKMYKEDDGAFLSFNRVLFAFKNSSKDLDELLQKAVKSNRFVVPKLIAKTISFNVPETYSLGDESEAKYYCFFAHKIWHETIGAIEWIKKQPKGPVRIKK